MNAIITDMDKQIYNTEKVHISLIRTGDVILHNGKAMTVDTNFISRDPFMGISIFGDTYIGGTQLVERIIFARWYKGKQIN